METPCRPCHDFVMNSLVSFLYHIALDEDDNPFRFVNVGDGPTRYTIVNFQKHPSKQTYNWQKVGDYSSKFKMIFLALCENG
jgi:hypothetical protein